MSCSFLCIETTPDSLVEKWSRCGKLADLFADWAIEDRDITDEAHNHRISTIMNELIENAAKFSVPGSRIFCEIHQIPYGWQMLIRNTCTTRQARSLRQHLDLFQHPVSLEQTYYNILDSRQGDFVESGLGLVTMMKDLGAELAVTFTEREDETTRVQVKVSISADFSLSLTMQRAVLASAPLAVHG